MSRPTTTPDWDTTSTNLSAPTSGHKASGFGTDEVPTSAELNGQFNLQGLWIAWLAGLFGSTGHLIELDSFLSTLNARTITRSRLPPLWGAINWSQGPNLSTYSNFSIQCTTLASNTAPLEMDIPLAHVLKSITITAKASAGGQGLLLTVFANATASLNGKTFLNGVSIGSVTVTSTDFTIHFDAKTSQSMTAQTTSDGGGVSPNIYTFTRTTGSFVTDGFIVGHTVDSSGWGITEHNFTGYIVASVSALTMTVQQVTPVARVSAAAETLVATVACTPVVSPAAGGALAAVLTATGSAGVAVANIAYTHQPAAIVFP